MEAELRCWRCGTAILDEPLPLSRRSECRACGAELKVCRMCRFYDTAVAKACREPIAEEVRHKDRANFCDYFEPEPDAYQPGDDRAAEQARTELEALFGGGNPESGAAAGESGGSDGVKDEAHGEFESLFRDRRDD